MASSLPRCLGRVGSHAARFATRPTIHVSRSCFSHGSHVLPSASLPGSRSGPLTRVQVREWRKCFAGQPQATDTIAEGDKLPDAKFNYFDEDGNMKDITTEQLCAGKKVILFAVPGAFTPTCSLKHLPGFIAKADEIKAAGVDTIACVAVNDAFVLDAWGKSIGAEGKVMMLADGSAIFTKGIGVDLNLEDKGLGIRSRRYAMLVEDMVVKVLKLEEGGAFTLSSAEDILAEL